MSTSAMFKFSKKLKALKPQLRKLSKEKLGGLLKRTKEAYEEMCVAKVGTLTYPSLAATRIEARIFAMWKKLADLEEKFLRQKSKLHRRQKQLIFPSSGQR